MKLTIEDCGYKYSVETPDSLNREEFVEMMQPVIDALWGGRVRLVDVKEEGE